MLPWLWLPCIHCMNTLHLQSEFPFNSRAETESCAWWELMWVNELCLHRHPLERRCHRTAGLLLISMIGQQPWIHLPETLSIYNPPPLSSNEASQQPHGKSKCCAFISFHFLGRWSVFRPTAGAALGLRRWFNQRNGWMHFLIKAFISVTGIKLA